MSVLEDEDKKTKVPSPGDTGWQRTLSQNNATGAPPQNDTPSRPLSSEEEEKFRQLTEMYNSEKSPERPTIDPKNPDLEGGEIKTTVGSQPQNKTTVAGWFKKHKKKIIWSFVGFGGVGSLFGLLLAPPMFIGENFKINATNKWSLRHINIGNAHRSASVETKKYYGIPGCNDKKRWSCYNNRGVTQSHIDRLKFAGFEIEGLRPAAGDSSRFQMDAMTIRSPSGETIRLTEENHTEMSLRDPTVRAAKDKFLKANSFTNRNARAIKLLASKGITRNAIPSEGTREENERKIREQNVNSANGNISADTPERGDESAADRQQRVEGASLINDSVEAAAADVDNYIENGTNPNNTPSTSELNNPSALTRLSQAGGNALLGGVKGLAQGPILNLISNGCWFYQTIRALPLAVQILGQTQVLQAVVPLLATSDAMLAGEANEKQMSMLGDALTRPSSEEATKGMTLGDSPGYTLITQGAVGNVGDLSRYNAGFTSASAIQSLLGTVSGNEGQLKSVCGGVNSIAGQITLSIVGLAACAGTIGASCLVGAATGVVAGGVLAAAAYYLLPTLASIIVGTYVLDYFTDPQGSYGMGNLMGYGAALLGSEFGQAGGFGTLSRDDYVALERETYETQQTIAAADAINYREEGLFEPSNPMSISTQLATALLPYAPTSLTATELFAKARGVTQRGLGAFSSHLYASSPLDQGSTLSDYRPDLCQSPTFRGSDAAVTGFCTEIKGPLPQTLPPVDSTEHDHHPYTFENIADWMQDNDYIDEAPDAIDMGEPLNEAKGDFRKFIDECRGDEIVLRDFDGQVINPEGESREDCNSKEEKFIRFDVYIQYRTVISAIEDAGNGELGGTGEAPQQDSGNLVDGTSQELAQQIMDSDSVTGDSRYMAQIRAVADGDGSCNINPTILQLVATMMRTYTMYISSLNRNCTNVLTASGTASYHYREGGGHAIDFAIINGKSSTGGTDEDIKFIKEAATLLPEGSGFGQVNCRARIELPGMRQFNDTCHHVHVEVPVQ